MNKKTLNLIWQSAIFISLTLVILGAYFYAPLAKGLKEFTRVLYFHVPSAWVTVVAFLVGAYYSVRYLKDRKLIYDSYAEAANQLGIAFCIITTITGAMWAKASWGAYWNWDPRETSIFILLLIYGAYFSLRSAVDQDETRARLSAVYDILAFITVPFFIFIVPRIYESLHPDPIINSDAKMHMDGKMLLVFLTSLTTFTIIFFWMLSMKKNLIHIKNKLELLGEHNA